MPREQADSPSRRRLGLGFTLLAAVLLVVFTERKPDAHPQQPPFPRNDAVKGCAKKLLDSQWNETPHAMSVGQARKPFKLERNCQAT